MVQAIEIILIEDKDLFTPYSHNLLMFADDLVTQGARTSTAIILT